MNTKQKLVIKNPNLYRARLSCKIGMDAIEGKINPPSGSTDVEYALYNLLSAVEDIAAEMERQNEHA